MIAYNEKCEDGSDCIIKITREEAISRQRAAGLTKDCVYPNDETALADFIEIHWAWEEVEYVRFGKRYRKLGRYETIKEGAMQSWCNGELQPIVNSDGCTVGDVPNSFSDERDFYNPILDRKATPDHPQCEGCDDMAECIEAVTYLGDDAICIRSRGNRILDAKDIKYNSGLTMDMWVYPIIVIGCTLLGLYAVYRLITFDASVF